MNNASMNTSGRGTLANWSDEVVAASLDIEPDHVTAIISAFQGLVLDGGRLTGWAKRQPDRNDDSRDRVRRHREARRNASVTPDDPAVTRGNGLDPDLDQDPDRESEKVAPSAPDSDSARATAPAVATCDGQASGEAARASERVRAAIAPRVRLRIAKRLGIADAEPIVDAFVDWQLRQPGAQRSRSIAAHFTSAAATFYANLPPDERARCGSATDDPDEIKPMAVTASPELRAALARAGGRP